MDEKQLKKITFIFGLGILLALFAPYFFTRVIGLPGFDTTGQIGDTIGGTTAPITSLIGSVLVFYALKAQIEANKLIQDQFNQQKLDEIERKKILYLSEQVNLVREDINDFSFTSAMSTVGLSGSTQKHYVTYKGSDAISKFIDSALEKDGSHFLIELLQKDPKLTELLNLLQVVDELIGKINSETIPEEDKLYFMSSLAYQFNSKIKPPFAAYEEYRRANIEVCRGCGVLHYAIPDKIFNLVDSISSRFN